MTAHTPRNPPLGDAARLAVIEAWARATYPDGEVPEPLANALWNHVPPRHEPDCDEWPECALDRDRCAAVAVMGQGGCPRLSTEKVRKVHLTRCKTPAAGRFAALMGLIQEGSDD